MSNDFLSKFSKDNYEKMIQEEKNKPEEPSVKKEVVVQNTPEDVTEQVPEEIVKENKEVTEEKVETVTTEEPKNEPSHSYRPTPQKTTTTSRTTRSEVEETEIDPDYKRRKRNKIIAIIAGSLLLLLLIFILWWNMTHEETPNLEGENVSNARVWGAENDVNVEVEYVYSTEQEENRIISQDPNGGETISKGSTLNLIVSQGPDPEEMLPMPDFSTMTADEATLWKEENHANNLTITRQYDDVIEDNAFIKLDMKDSSVTPETYKRKDEAILYYSRGQETLEKNINVPDFKDKPIQEVQSWATSNQIDLEVLEVTSNNIPEGMIVSQGIPSGEKVARKDKFSVQVSVGKALIVPNYASYSQEELALFTDIPTTSLQRYNSTVPYGRLISQSVSPGTEFTEKNVETVILTYSLGKPYIDDLRGSQTEGTLQQYFYDTYTSKGADIGYRVYYVDSNEPRGSVVQQSIVGQILPMRSEVSFGISLGNLYPTNPTDPSPNPGGDGDIDDGTGGDYYPGEDYDDGIK